MQIVSTFRGAMRRSAVRAGLATLALGGLILVQPPSSTGTDHVALAASPGASDPVAARVHSHDAPRAVDAFAHLEPESGGPTNEVSVTLGSRFNLNLMVNSGSNNIVVAQSYLTFSRSLLQVVGATSPLCAPTTTLTIDPTNFDTELQNEVCNDSIPCDFGRLVAPPASIAFASGSSPNAPTVHAYFRVAQVGLCANALGDAVLHWQFSPPAT